MVRSLRFRHVLRLFSSSSHWRWSSTAAWPGRPESLADVTAAASHYFLPADAVHVPPLDWHRLLDRQRAHVERAHVERRKGGGDIDRVHALHDQYLQLCRDSVQTRHHVLQQLVREALLVPNWSRPTDQQQDEDDSRPRLLRTVGQQQSYDFPLKDFSWRASKLGMLRHKKVGGISGKRTYFLLHDMAVLEAALLRYTTSRLRQLGFQLVSVPDLVDGATLHACGLHVDGQRTMAYRVISDNCESSDDTPTSDSEHSSRQLFLSGTAEMALSAMLRGRCLHVQRDLPLRLAAVSRCYRPEVSELRCEGGIYRVHQFNKVEMYGVCEGSVEASQRLLHEFVDIQQELFSSLGLHFHVYDMPPHELGAPAYRKLDIEAWMPARGVYGEVSSASDCTDYQARRLAITCQRETSNTSARFVHTVNGTACAAPRTLIALVETHQLNDGRVHVPVPLRPFMRGAGRNGAIIERRAHKWRHLDSHAVQMNDQLETDVPAAVFHT